MILKSKVAGICAKRESRNSGHPQKIEGMVGEINISPTKKTLQCDEDGASSRRHRMLRVAENQFEGVDRRANLPATGCSFLRVYRDLKEILGFGRIFMWVPC